MENLYPGLFKNFHAHYYGDDCLIFNLNKEPSSLYDLTEVEADILEQCNGNNTVAKVNENILKLYNVNPKDNIKAKSIINNFIHDLNKKGVLSLRAWPIKKEECGICTGLRNKLYPYYVNIEITNNCNFFCKHCYKNANSTNAQYLSYDIFKNIISTLKGKTYYMQVTGGEPLLHPQFAEFVEMFSDDFRLFLMTNGTNIKRYNSDIFRNFYNVQISMYGNDTESYEIMTGSNSAFNDFKIGVQLLTKNSIQVTVAVILNKINYLKIEDYVKICIDLGVHDMRFGSSVPVGRAFNKETYNGILALTKTDIEEITQELQNLKEKYSGKIIIRSWDNKKTNVNMNFNENAQNGKFPCGAGGLSLVFSEQGWIRPCLLLPPDLFNMCYYTELNKIIDGTYKVRWNNTVRGFDNMLKKNDAHIIDICPSLSELGKIK